MPTRTNDEILTNGNQIDVQARLSRTGDTQLFLGVYDRAGRIIVEEAYDSLPGKTITKALIFGTQRARRIGAEGQISGDRVAEVN
jgi:hypothetical protein